MGVFMKLNLTLQRYLDDVRSIASLYGMTISQPKPSDETLYSVKGGRKVLQFSIKPVKLVSVWQLYDSITDRINKDLRPYELRNIRLKLNRRITINLMRYGIEEKELIQTFLELNKL